MRSDPAAFRRAAIPVLQAALAGGRNEARKALEAGGTGRACAEALSAQMDDLLQVGSTSRLAGSRPPPAGTALPTIVAVGGYGRGLLAPASDIDLLFLLPDKPTPAAQKVVETLLYVLWDLKLKVGHATRTVDECLKQARGDMTIRTTLIEARLVTGDKTAVRDAADALRQGDRRQDRARIRRRQARRARGARPARGRVALSRRTQREGGQGRPARSQHAVLDREIRLSRAAMRTSWSRSACSRPREFALFRRCEEFLWSVRCRLHFLAGRAEERLSFDVQRPIARQLGYSTRAGQADVERFMKHYFLVAKDVGDLTAIVCAALEERQTKPTPVFDRFIGRLRRSTRAIADTRDFKVENDRINVIRRRRLRARPGQSDPPVLDRRPFEPAHSSGCDATRDAVAEAHRRRLAREPGGEPPFPRDPDLAALAGDGAQAHERGRRARPLHSRFRPGRRHDAVLDVSPLHDRRAPAADRRRAQRDRGRAAQGRPSAGERDRPPDHPSHRALSRGLSARHRQGPAGRPFAGGRRGRAQALSAARPLAGQHRTRRLARRAASHHVQHGAGARPFRSADGRSARGDRADPGAAQDAARR